MANRIERLADATLRTDSIERVQLWRNGFLGGAAANLVVLTGLLQVADKSSNAFLAATLLIAVSLPCWVLGSNIYETYLLLGQSSLEHLQSATMKRWVSALLGIAGFSLWGAVASTITILSGYAAAVFVIASIVAFALASFLNVLLARWWFGPGGPGRRDVDDTSAN